MARRHRRARNGPPPSQRANRPPSYTERPPLPLVEIPVPVAMLGSVINENNNYVRIYRLGECSVIVTKEFGEWHLSVAHTRRLPHWDEVTEARYRLVPDEVTMAMLLPPKREYINLHPNCFQLVEIPTETIVP